jgi:hypothetical protein
MGERVNREFRESSPIVSVICLGVLCVQDRRERIRGLGSEQGNGSETSASSVESLGDVIGQLEMLLARLKARA